MDRARKQSLMDTRPKLTMDKAEENGQTEMERGSRKGGQMEANEKAKVVDKGLNMGQIVVIIKMWRMRWNRWTKKRVETRQRRWKEIRSD